MKPWEKYAEPASAQAPAPTASGPWDNYKDVPQAQTEPSTLKNLAMGGLRGITNVIDTGAGYLSSAADALTGGNERARVDAMNKERAQIFKNSADTDSLAYKGGTLAGEIGSTWGVGGFLGQGAKALGMQKLGSSIASGGLTVGSKAAPGVAGTISDLGIRSAGGAVMGGATAGLANQDNALTGALVGAVLPPAVGLLKAAGGAIAKTINGPEVPASIQSAVSAAREAGYVVPPSQAKPTLGNRALEGFSGKITTAQNASAKNQPVTNELARKAIGAAELSPEGIAQVRTQANKAYDALGQSAPFKADEAFTAALDRAGSNSAALRKNFPELQNAEIDNLIDGLKSRGEFEAQPTIEAIKRFRSDASANKISMDPAKKALGKAQSNIANSLEDLIERNLQTSGDSALLDGYRAARQTLAKTYEVEKAMNPASGNIDGNALAKALKKGKPLSGELKTIAEFASQFPKANQTIERMGSLPQSSPLDWHASGAASFATGNPLMLAGVLARPAARSVVLSAPVQNALARPVTPSRIGNALSNRASAQLGYRAAPLAYDQK